MSDSRLSPIRARNVNTEILRDRLCRMTVGEEITYSDLSKLISSDVQHHSRARSWLQSARKAAFTETSAIFGVTTNIGLRRLNDAQALEVTRSAIDGMRRKAKRVSRVLASLNPENLTADQRSRLYARLTIAAVTTLACESRVEAKMLPAVTKAQSALPTGAILEQMRSM